MGHVIENLKNGVSEWWTVAVLLAREPLFVWLMGLLVALSLAGYLVALVLTRKRRKTRAKTKERMVGFGESFINLLDEKDVTFEQFENFYRTVIYPNKTVIRRLK